MCFVQNNAQMLLSKRILTTQCHPYRAERPVSEISCATTPTISEVPWAAYSFCGRNLHQWWRDKSCTGPPYLVLIKFRFYHPNFDQNGVASGAVSMIFFPGPQTFVSRLPHFSAELQTLLRTAEKDLGPYDISIFPSSGWNSLP